MTQQTNQNEWDRAANEIMFALIAEGKPFNADDFCRKAREIKIPPQALKRISGSIFKRFKAYGYIKKLPTYRLSERNSSNVLPMWTTATTENGANK
jgi:hypothetical protein